jgi:hypothetical protein
MLEETIAWRKNFGIPQLLNEFKETIKTENATGKMYVRGFDREGNPLIYLRPANENTKDHDGNIKHLVYTMERAVACMDAAGQGNTKLSLVIDYGGYTSSHMPTMKTSKETLNILQNHYPERLRTAYCIRAPFVFYAFFKMVSPFIDPVTKKKISMIKNSELGKAECQLNREISQSVLEKSVGGTDERPFNSAIYLGGAYDREFKYLIDLSEGKLDAPLPNSPSPVPVPAGQQLGSKRGSVYEQDDGSAPPAPPSEEDALSAAFAQELLLTAEKELQEGVVGGAAAVEGEGESTAEDDTAAPVPVVAVAAVVA